VPSYAIELARAAVSSSRLTDLVMHGRVLSPMEALSMHIAEGVHAPEALRSKLPSNVQVLDGVGTVTVVGTALHADGQVLRTALGVARAQDARVIAMTSSSLQLTMVADRGAIPRVTRALHEALIG